MSFQSVFAFTHKIWCTASWIDNNVFIQGHFKIYDDFSIELGACDECIRDAKYDGVWAYNKGGTPHMIYQWPRPTGKAGKASSLGEEIKV
ncbi:hypothetical protein FRX31_031740 [Thalictrum thalictroides]|uniref:Uncharacterized protein n=1 Tax=Thalictrum thalictroides TaxID=46969 RepID=A0A7J6V3G5_THATH|nr:hypothetical protein FRX31_031740 [Thalictrum thalictroides]